MQSGLPSHYPARIVKGAVHQQLLDLATDGIIEWHDPNKHTINDFADNVNPFGAVPKPDGSNCLRTDPSASGVNASLRHLPCKLPRVGDALRSSTSSSFLAKRDLAREFYHMTLHASSRPFMGFHDPGTTRSGR